MSKEYRILCEECDRESVILVEEDFDIEFCPCCGRRAEPEDISEADDI